MAQRRNKGEGSISERGDGKWLIQVVIGYDQDGRLRKKSKICKNKTEAVKALKLLQLEKQRNNITLQGSILFEEFMVRWLELKRKILRPKSYMDYERICKCEFLPKFGKVNMEKIKTSMVNDFLHRQLERGVSNSTVNKYKILLSGIFKLALAENVVSKNPLQGSMVIKKVKPQTTYIKKEDMERILSKAKKLFDETVVEKRSGSNIKCLYPVILTAYHTGMRINEILALRWENIDLEKNEIKVCENLTEAKDINGKIRLIVGAPKTNDSIRIIKISQTLEKVLRDLGSDEKYVFTSEVGGYIASSNFSRVWRKLLNNLGLRGQYRFHDIRHTHATELIGAGYNIKAVSQRLGHADVQTTLNIYAHALPKQDEEMAEFFDVVDEKNIIGNL